MISLINYPHFVKYSHFIFSFFGLILEIDFKKQYAIIIVMLLHSVFSCEASSTYSNFTQSLTHKLTDL
jgi:hypothetical protein